MDKIPSQKGKLAVVTGANIGLGYETALELAKKDFEVVLACRNLVKAEDAKQSIKANYPDAKINCIELDLSRLASVHQFVELLSMHYQQLDLLINNAGIMMTPYHLTEDGFESQLGTNFLGHFLLTGLLLPLLEKTRGSRIITLSSLAHRWGNIRLEDLNFKKGYNARSAYGQSKLACLLFAYELDRKLKANEYQTISIAAHPGIAITNLISHFNPIVKSIARLVAPLLFQSPKKGALPILKGALDPDVGGGEYFGPGGFREYKGAPVKVGSSAISKDQKLAQQLWKMAEQMTGFNYFSKN